NLIVMLHIPPPWRVLPLHPSGVSVKSVAFEPVTPVVRPVTCAPPVLVTVTVAVLLPGRCSDGNEADEIMRAPGRTAVPLSDIVTLAAPLPMVTEPDLLPAVVGAKTIIIEHDERAVSG